MYLRIKVYADSGRGGVCVCVCVKKSRAEAVAAPYELVQPVVAAAAYASAVDSGRERRRGRRFAGRGYRPRERGIPVSWVRLSEKTSWRGACTTLRAAHTHANRHHCQDLAAGKTHHCCGTSLSLNRPAHRTGFSRTPSTDTSDL